MKRLLITTSVTVSLVGAGIGGAPAAAAAVHADCIWNTICVHYSPNLQNSMTAFDAADPDLSSPSVKFLSSGTGKGQPVYDNGASAWNTHVSYHARIYKKKNYNGYDQLMEPVYQSGDQINFTTDLRNRNRSLRFTLS